MIDWWDFKCAFYCQPQSKLYIGMYAIGTWVLDWTFYFYRPCNGLIILASYEKSESKLKTSYEKRLSRTINDYKIFKSSYVFIEGYKGKNIYKTHLHISMFIKILSLTSSLDLSRFILMPQPLIESLRIKKLSLLTCFHSSEELWDFLLDFPS